MSAGREPDERTLRFLELYARRDKLALTELLVPMERLKRDQLEPLLLEWIESLEQALAARSGGMPASDSVLAVSRGRTSQQLLAAISALRRSVELCRGNISVAAICGALQIWLT